MRDGRKELKRQEQEPNPPHTQSLHLLRAQMLPGILVPQVWPLGAGVLAVGTGSWGQAC